MKLPRHAEIWLPSYLVDRALKFMGGSSPIRYVWVTVADHFEPLWNGADLNRGRSRVEEWRTRWPVIASTVGVDDFNSPARYTFFYPVEQYHPELLDPLAELTHMGIADVEVHLHHDGEGREDFVERITTFCDWLADRHGLLRKVSGRTRFGFIHGNWALDNSLPSGRWCGLNDEITLLRDLGCYADFTMPSGACASQARMINSIYWCTDNPHLPKSYDRGVAVQQGKTGTGDLLMIPGPLGLRWRGRLVPRMETAEIASYDPPTSYRVRRWLDLAPRIGEHAFLKLYTHGAQNDNLKFLLSHGLDDFFSLTREEACRRGAKMHFVSAWQMFLAIEALSRGKNPATAVEARENC